MEKSHEVSIYTCLICEIHIPTDREEDICEKCAKNLEKPAFLFCMKCLSLWSLISPGPMRYGRYLESGKRYNTDTCPTCKPGHVSFKIKEQEAFKQNLN